jgi:hypothetical protein
MFVGKENLERHKKKGKKIYFGKGPSKMNFAKKKEVREGKNVLKKAPKDRKIRSCGSLPFI